MIYRTTIWQVAPLVNGKPKKLLPAKLEYFPRIAREPPKRRACSNKAPTLKLSTYRLHRSSIFICLDTLKNSAPQQRGPTRADQSSYSMSPDRRMIRKMETVYIMLNSPTPLGSIDPLGLSQPTWGAPAANTELMDAWIFWSPQLLWDLHFSLQQVRSILNFT